MFTNDDVFIQSLGNNFRFMILVVIFQTGFSLLFATYLTKNTRTTIFLRTLYFFPTILSSVSVGLIWLALYDPNYGFINASLNALGFESLALNWLGDSRYALYALSLSIEKHSANQNTPIFMAHGTYDPVVVLDRAQASHALLEKLAYRVNWNEYPMEHSVHHEELADISRFLQEVLPKN